MPVIPAMTDEKKAERVNKVKAGMVISMAQATTFLFGNQVS